MFPAERCAALYITRGAPSQHRAQMLGGQPIRRTDRPDIVLRERFPRPDRLHNPKRTAKGAALGLLRSHAVMHHAQRFLRHANRFDHRLEFRRFERKSAVRSRRRAGEGKMLFDNARA